MIAIARTPCGLRPAGRSSFLVGCLPENLKTRLDLVRGQVRNEAPLKFRELFAGLSNGPADSPSCDAEFFGYLGLGLRAGFDGMGGLLAQPVIAQMLGVFIVASWAW